MKEFAATHVRVREGNPRSVEPWTSNGHVIRQSGVKIVYIQSTMGDIWLMIGEKDWPPSYEWDKPDDNL